MNKKIIVLLASSLAMIACATTASAKDRTSPFTDNLSIQFSEFPTDMPFSAIYQSDNGVDITGYFGFDTNIGDSVTINSDNLYHNGDPSMTLSYPTYLGPQTCTLNFVDGPWTTLAYLNGSVPACTGLTIGAIVLQSQYNYKITVAYNGPSA